MLETFEGRLKYVIEVIMTRTEKNKRMIAEELTITPSALTQLTTGKSKTASQSTLELLNKKFDINIDWLLNGDYRTLNDMFNSDSGFSNLRKEIKLINRFTGEKTIVCTMKGWAKILDYKSTADYNVGEVNQTLLNKVDLWHGVSGSIRNLLATPIYLDNYSTDTCEGTTYEHILFYLEGTRPHGYIIASKVNGLLSDDQHEFEDRIILNCLQIYGYEWSPIKLARNSYDYYIDLSISEYLRIMNKPLPQHHIKKIRG